MSDKGKNNIWIGVSVLTLLVILGNIDIITRSIPGMETISSVIAKYIFGFEEYSGFGLQLSSYALIITHLMMWFIIFSAFGDIFELFSTFSSGTAWIIAFAMATIVAFSGGVNQLLILLTGIFAFLGTMAIYAGLVAAFVIFFGVQWGFQWAIKIAQRQRLAKQSLEIKAEAEKTKSAVEAIQKTGEAFE